VAQILGGKEQYIKMLPPYSVHSEQRGEKEWKRGEGQRKRKERTTNQDKSTARARWGSVVSPGPMPWAERIQIGGGGEKQKNGMY